MLSSRPDEDPSSRERLYTEAESETKTEYHLPHPPPLGYLYPFSAIVGQDSMKLALILNAISPRVGGVLISGDKGTAKSTAVRALARLLPEIESLDGSSPAPDPEHSRPLSEDRHGELTTGRTPGVPFVELPLNATEEMVVGGLDFSASVREGRGVFQRGLLARAHQGILYVDEVNLLPDHLVDTILDVSASGENVVQREGISHRHPARFILVGTMNPDEGELRPQFLDRFGLCVQVEGEQDAASRLEVLVLRDQFDRDPRSFCRRFESRDRALARAIAEARRILPHIGFPGYLERAVAKLCLRHNVAGHRADIVITYTARVLAAFEGHSEATLGDVRRAALLALPHRSRERVQDGNSPAKAHASRRSDNRRMPGDDDGEYPKQEPNWSPMYHAGLQEIEFDPSRRPRERSDHPEAIFDVGPTFKVREIAHRPDRLFRQQPGKRTRTRTGRKRGRYVRSTPNRMNGDVALDATLRAAAPFQKMREAENGLVVAIRDEDIREKVRETRTGNFLLFVVDASGSMGAKGRMIASKGAIMSVLQDAYRKRDRVAMVSFRKQQAAVNLPPTSSIYRAGRLLKELPVGGKTPLAAGLRKGQAVLRNVLLKDPECRPIAIIMTDGKANESMGKGDPFWEALSIAKSLASEKRLKSVVVDAEEFGGFRYGLAGRLAEVLRAEYLKITDLRADILREIVRSNS
jgi:magnesium chelatase subunit D